MGKKKRIFQAQDSLGKRKRQISPFLRGQNSGFPQRRKGKGFEKGEPIGDWGEISRMGRGYPSSLLWEKKMLQ